MYVSPSKSKVWYALGLWRIVNFLAHPMDAWTDLKLENVKATLTFMNSQRWLVAVDSGFNVVADGIHRKRLHKW